MILNQSGANQKHECYLLNTTLYRVFATVDYIQRQRPVRQQTVKIHYDPIFQRFFPFKGKEAFHFYSHTWFTMDEEMGRKEFERTIFFLRKRRKEDGDESSCEVTHRRRTEK
ncbi:hypothetical protein CEXT_504221 [Caerostris extrusa]|uniref:Uncharacterized protein n=1 Tax=Caerostris extrusa TaxID=172846 RepID=A0AAV4P0R5_CAEEX|nr:hypothetical protein CEXT_504221 [Caerostris extrusa]